jgi:hypothetical protein
MRRSAIKATVPSQLGNYSNDRPNRRDVRNPHSAPLALRCEPRVFEKCGVKLARRVVRVKRARVIPDGADVEFSKISSRLEHRTEEAGWIVYLDPHVVAVL